MHDPTENIRKEMVEQINENPSEREILEAKHGQVWDTKELTKEFNVNGFMAPFVMVTRKTDGKKGTLMFQHYPRYYYEWKEK